MLPFCVDLNLNVALVLVVGVLGFLALAVVVARYGAGTIGAVAFTVVTASALTQTVLFETTLWFAASLFLGRTGAGYSRESPGGPIQW